jgi:hypothetical protein
MSTWQLLHVLARLPANDEAIIRLHEHGGISILAAAALPHKGNSCPCRDVQRKAPEDEKLRLGGIGKCDVHQLYVALNAVWLLALFLIIYRGLSACTIMMSHQGAPKAAPRQTFIITSHSSLMIGHKGIITAFPHA